MITSLTAPLQKCLLVGMCNGKNLSPTPRQLSHLERVRGRISRSTMSPLQQCHPRTHRISLSIKGATRMCERRFHTGHLMGINRRHGIQPPLKVPARQPLPTRALYPSMTSSLLKLPTVMMPWFQRTPTCMADCPCDPPSSQARPCQRLLNPPKIGCRTHRPTRSNSTQCPSTPESRVPRTIPTRRFSDAMGSEKRMPDSRYLRSEH